MDQLKEKQGDLVDIVGTSFATYAISQRVIGIIEAIEPNVHQYLAYQMLHLMDRSILISDGCSMSAPAPMLLM